MSATTIDLTERARAVALIADQHAEFGDSQGRLADPVVDALHREGLFGMWVPKSLPGGAELDPVSSLQVIENLAYGDPSAGWVLMAAALAVGTGAAFLSEAAVSELFGKPRLPVIAGQGTRPGLAVPKDDGFMLSGSWSFASGIKHGTHIHTLGLIEGTGEARIFVLPVGKATLIENWDVLGLRATGSIDYRIDSVFVPEGYTHPALIDTPKRGGGLYQIGVIGFAIMCHSAWACGIGRRVLDELVKNVRGKMGRAGTLATSEAFHQQHAKAEGTLSRRSCAGLRSVERRTGHTRTWRAFVHAATHVDPIGDGTCDVVGARGGDVCLCVGGHGRAPVGYAPAAVPRHARRYSARHVVSARVPGYRS
jgi:alkylation response protein AidB-like acyl-CoA dehydrogenase